jgi:hypothetical protein
LTERCPYRGVVRLRHLRFRLYGDLLTNGSRRRVEVLAQGLIYSDDQARSLRRFESRRFDAEYSSQSARERKRSRLRRC